MICVILHKVFFEQDQFSEDAENLAMIMHEALFLLEFFQTKQQFKNQHKTFYDFYFSKSLASSHGGEIGGFIQTSSCFFS